MNNQWFYLQQWRQKAWQRLLEYRTIRVHWDTDNIDSREVLPKFVKLPEEVELTNKGISNYLSDTFDWCVLDWSVAQGEINETRV
tara:strand:- start:220 stop:474 length:255 start_codon:yes stop_codon:yes gene_type:complete